MDFKKTYNGFIVGYVNIVKNTGKYEWCKDAQVKEPLDFNIFLCRMLKHFVTPWVTERTHAKLVHGNRCMGDVQWLEFLSSARLRKI